MNHYLEDLLRKYPLGLKLRKQYGGSKPDTDFVPKGGFPPIYICDVKTEEAKDTSKREYSTHKSSVSIKDILKKRRDVTPVL